MASNLKVAAKKHGFKVIGGIAYTEVGEILYELYISLYPKELGKVITTTVLCKPTVLDGIFWKVFQIEDEIVNQPFSIHVNGAFVAPIVELNKFKISVKILS